MAEFLWTFAVEGILKKVLTVVNEQISLSIELKKVLEKLKQELVEAEKMVNAITSKPRNHFSQDGLVAQWVNDLQLIVNEAEDLLDLFVYEHLQQEVGYSADQKTINKVSSFLCGLKPSLVFPSVRTKKMKEIIELLSEHRTKLPQLVLLDPTTSEIETEFRQIQETISKPEDYVVGRTSEVESIVDQVIETSKHQLNSILPVFGMGGSGKTTLARLVFNHERIKIHFHITIWICVSEPFVINKILQAILQKVADHPSDFTNNREALLEKLKIEMNGKRYFLVLDDVWNENQMLWEKLKECLMSIVEASGSSVLVTTRSSGIAQMMKQNLGSHPLNKLSDDKCWSIFRNFASASEVPMTSKLEYVRGELVKKIGGLPLVAKVFGAAVQYTGDYAKWVTSLERILTTPLKEEEFVKFVLKLSVDRLPKASIKQCFAYCSNFSKGCEFDKKQMIQMWMAQGFTQPDKESNETMEDIGDRYFNILLSYCLFQDVVKDKRGRIKKFRMHDLIHDIVCHISNDKKLQLDHNISLIWKHWTKEDKKVASKLRTIIFNGDEMVADRIKMVVANFVCLRVLTITVDIDELPDSISKLKHLRYLDILCCYSITKLPKSIVLLRNLETLRFRCLSKGFLPENAGQMVSLRHLEFSIIGQHMAPYLSQLIQLQTLPSFEVGIEEGCKITELRVLRNLKGFLKLKGLEHVGSKEEAETAKLMEKENLQELHFVWTRKSLREVDNQNDLEVLEGLQPHKNLRYLKIKSYLGECFPNQTFVDNLVNLTLLDCRNCEKLPMLGQLGNLERLKISKFYEVKTIGYELYGKNNSNNQRTLFPKLKEIYVRNLRNLVQWEEVPNNVRAFPRLEILHIVSCRELVKIPDLFGYCDEYGVKHLEVVEIKSCFQLTELPKGLRSCQSIQQVKLNQDSKLWSFLTFMGGPLANARIIERRYLPGFFTNRAALKFITGLSSDDDSD